MRTGVLFYQKQTHSPPAISKSKYLNRPSLEASVAPIPKNRYLIRKVATLNRFFIDKTQLHPIHHGFVVGTYCLKSLQLIIESI